MSTFFKGSLNGLDTKDTHEISRKVRKYNYTVKAKGKGTLRFKIDYLDPGQIGVGADHVPAKWRTLVKRHKVDGGKSCSGSFELQGFDDESRSLKMIFSRGVGTKGVDYDFEMEKA